MDRATLAELETERIAAALASGTSADRWTRLVERAGEDAADLLQLVCRLAPPERIFELCDLETRQCERGAGFLGMLPDQIPGDLPVPTDVDGSLESAIRLAEVRAASVEALSETMPDYPLSFSGHTFDPDPVGDVPAGWQLDVDVDAIRAVLDFLDAGKPDAEAAAAIARMRALTEMMRHRRELGYVPEPLIDEDGFAWCLVHAASRDPVDALWKWLHPQNLFDLSDLFAHRDDYRQLIDRLVDGDRLAAYVLGSIAPYAPPYTPFEDRLSFAVGWGIRGWATQETGGMNIEHTKDDFDRLLPTLIHETFHRLQTSIALANSQIEEPGFDRITSQPFESGEDRQLYRALAYVMLEGSATYVATPEPADDTWSDDATAGLALLKRIRAVNASTEASETYDELLNEGLRSNGPFYGLGAFLSRAIVEDAGRSSLGAALRRGAPFFVERGLQLADGVSLARSDKLAERINHLRARLEDAT